MRFSDFSEGVIRQIARRDPALDWPRMSRPRASLAVGAAGIALFLAEVAQAAKGATRIRLAERALAWVTAAKQAHRHFGTAYGFPGRPLKDSVGGLGVFHGRAGVLAVAARVAAVRGDDEAIRAAATRFVETWRRAAACADFPTEPYFGSAGFIFAARDLRAQSKALGSDLSERVRAVGCEAHARVCEKFDRLARGVLPEGLRLGYAHGLAGELDAAMAWNSEPSVRIAAVLDRLLAQAVVEEDLIAWPVRVGDEPAGPLWASWCNGVAGHVYLWCRAYEVFRDERYLTLARLAAQTTNALRPGIPTVCCGSAGQALALYRYFRLTGDRSYRRRAVARARCACAQAQAAPALALSYFTGLSGIAHLAFMIEAKGTPSLPLVEFNLSLRPASR